MRIPYTLAMIYRALGATGLQVSIVGLGTWQFSGEWGRDYSERDARLIIDAARQQGITLIDTAECYGDHLSERLVGAAIRADRDRWVVATKFGHAWTGHLGRDQKWSAGEVRGQLEASLRALALETIDLYQFHSGRNDVFDNDELWAMLQEQKKAGKIRHVGISISSSIPEPEKDHQALRARAVGAECLQVVYNRLDRRPEDRILPLARTEGLGFLARVPLASGFLSGAIRPDRSFSPSDHRSQKSPEEIRRTVEEVERIRKEEVPAGTSMAAWALAWCLRQPGVTAVIPGASRPEQVVANASAAHLLQA